MSQLNDEVTVIEPAALQSLVERCVRSGLNVLSGPSGIGKTTILRGIEETLAHRGIPVLRLSCRTVSDQLTLLSCPPDRMLLADDVEFARAGTLRFLLQRLLRGEPTILALNEAHWSSSFGAVLDEVLLDHEELLDVLSTVPRVRLEPWAPCDIERLAHRKSPLASSEVAAIVELAQGRPLWAEHLVSLMAEHKVECFPFPRLVRLTQTDVHTRPFHRAREAVGPLDPGALEIALALSRVSEVSALFARTLLGDHRYEQLLQRELLLPTGPRQARLRANRFVLEALAPEADYRLVDQASVDIAEHFLAAQRAGDQLSTEEVLLTARAFLRATPSEPSTESPEHTHSRAQLLLQAMDILADAGEHEEAREYLLAAQLLGVSIDHIRLARATSDPASAMHSLQAFDIAAAENTERLALQIVCSTLRAEQGVPTSLPDEETCPADCLVTAWNTAEPLNTLTKTTIDELASSNTAPPEVTLLALSLQIFETIWQGAAIPQPLANQAALRYQLTFSTPGTSGQVARDARATFAVVLGLAELLHGPAPALNEVFSLHGPRASLASPWAPWAYPLRGAIRALRGEQHSLALDEWDTFTANLPRYLPPRLRRAIRSIRQAIVATASPLVPPADPQNPAPEGKAYPSILLRALSARAQSPENWLPALPSKPLRQPTPVLSALLHAQHSLRIESPAALCESALRLRACGLPRHAIETMNAATSLLLRRRASHNSFEAAKVLEELQRAALQEFPFIPQERLSPRESKALSPRERETAVLASQGFSNKVIAEKMRLSVRTVESHLAQARAKLGATNRHQIADRLSAHITVTQEHLSSPTPELESWSQGTPSRSSAK